MLKDFWKIDVSQGESRFAQLLGIWLLICLIVFFIWHFEGANLNGTNSISANLSFSDNSSAELENANFKGANTAYRQLEIRKLIQSSRNVQFKLQ
jgi:uncharacterized protein YjbI with pentapeptide repeats